MGAGILLTVGVGFVTNAALPYWYHNFRFIHIGTLSTIFFLVLVAYAACFQGLFNVRVLVKKTVVFALLIAFALELYQFAVGALAGLLPLGDPTQRHLAAATIALVINAVTQQPLRWWLERLADRLLAGKHPEHHNTPQTGYSPLVTALAVLCLMSRNVVATAPCGWLDRQARTLRDTQARRSE